jgi:hypothetical protein
MYRRTAIFVADSPDSVPEHSLFRWIPDVSFQVHRSPGARGIRNRAISAGLPEAG